MTGKTDHQEDSGSLGDCPQVYTMLYTSVDEYDSRLRELSGPRPFRRVTDFTSNPLVWDLKTTPFIRSKIMHQEKSRSLMSTSFFSVNSPANFGRLRPFPCCEVGT